MKAVGDGVENLALIAKVMDFSGILGDIMKKYKAEGELTPELLTMDKDTIHYMRDEIRLDLKNNILRQIWKDLKVMETIRRDDEGEHISLQACLPARKPKITRAKPKFIED